MEHIVIIGNGIAGITAARNIRKKSDKKITIISAESKYFFSRTALMYVFMGHMKFEQTQPYEDWFWEKNNLELIQDKVTSVDFAERKLELASGKFLNYDKLILATGSKPNKFGWPGQDSKGVTGLYSKQDLERVEELANTTKEAVVVGGGLIGIELVEMLLTRGIKVSFLVREKSFWNGVLPPEESEMINKHIREHGANLRLGTNLKEIHTDSSGRVKEVELEDGEIIPCQFVGLTVGVSPNIDFLKDSGLELDRGILVNRKLETSEPNVYAIGDCAQQREAVGMRRPIEAVWYTGKIMGEAVAKTICDKPTEYAPGVWFNSAKFFDIEYQTYGWVWANPKEYENQFYWEDQSGKKSFRLSYHKKTGEILGVLLHGMRGRHEVFESWLNQKKSIEYVLEHLEDFHFDPEFYKKHQKEIIKKYNRENGTQIQLKKFSWDRILPKIKGAWSWLPR